RAHTWLAGLSTAGRTTGIAAVGLVTVRGRRRKNRLELNLSDRGPSATMPILLVVRPPAGRLRSQGTPCQAWGRAGSRARQRPATPSVTGVSIDSPRTTGDRRSPFDWSQRLDSPSPRKGPAHGISMGAWCRDVGQGRAQAGTVARQDIGPDRLRVAGGPT